MFDREAGAFGCPDVVNAGNPPFPRFLGAKMRPPLKLLQDGWSYEVIGLEGWARAQGKGLQIHLLL